MAEKQLIIEEIMEETHLSQLGMTRIDWNIARNLMCQEPNGYDLFDFTLESVVSDPLLKKEVLFEIRSAKSSYLTAITSCKRDGDSELLEKLQKEYDKLCSEPSRTK